MSGRSFLSSSRNLSRLRGILSKFARTASATVCVINSNRGTSEIFAEEYKKGETGFDTKQAQYLLCEAPKD